MHVSDLNALVEKVSQRIGGRKLPKGTVNLFARQAVEAKGITNKLDVNRLSRQICSELGKHSGVARRSRTEVPTVGAYHE